MIMDRANLLRLTAEMAAMTLKTLVEAGELHREEGTTWHIWVAPGRGQVCGDDEVAVLCQVGFAVRVGSKATPTAEGVEAAAVHLGVLEQRIASSGTI